MSLQRNGKSPGIRVTIANQTEHAVPSRKLKEAVLAAAVGTPYSAGRINVALVDDDAIHQLNRRFLEHDYPTDVLSFPLCDAPPRVEGDIVVSVDTAQREASRAGWKADDELLLYIVHGALHLMGHDDKSARAARAMHQAELAALAQLGIEPSAADDRWQEDGLESRNTPQRRSGGPIPREERPS